MTARMRGAPTGVGLEVGEVGVITLSMMAVRCRWIRTMYEHGNVQSTNAPGRRSGTGQRDRAAGQGGFDGRRDRTGATVAGAGGARRARGGRRGRARVAH